MCIRETGVRTSKSVGEKEEVHWEGVFLLLLLIIKHRLLRKAQREWEGGAPH